MKLNKSVQSQFADFEKGFHKGCPTQAWRMFLPEELMTLLQGDDNYEWDKLREVKFYLLRYVIKVHKQYNMEVHTCLVAYIAALCSQWLNLVPFCLDYTVYGYNTVAWSTVHAVVSLCFSLQ